ncbi:uncharacterized protein LOC120624836 [Pararge aegeria]|uniref:uncharacterized protein LOC120624836 n=1 Tax=Pararge aegeria TaxID=116150 RepID=UPI0019CF7624|nr:uncharacterized protein LOC120624836 [Pararge aegeria]
MLALLLLLYHAAAKGVSDNPQDTYIIEKIVSCPDVGYYFKRDLRWNAIEPACRLCFCRDNGTAVCWRRELRRCDVQHYHHFRDKKRDRIRRSPGLAEVFFRDAAKDVFNKNTSEECKPYESSYSKGCPPADWCLGCTVCDCDANGRWDCHTLSFCTDDKGKKKMRNKITKPQALKKKAPTTIKKQKPETSKKPNKYHPPKNIIKAKGKQLSQINEPAKSQSKFTKKRNKPKNLTIKKAKAPVYKKKPTPKSNEKSNSKIIKKSMQPSSVQIVKGNTKTLKDNEEVIRDIAHTIYKKVMDAVEKIVMDSKKNISHKKNLQKQHCLHKGKRSKREITSMISTATDTNTTEESFVYQSFDSGVIKKNRKQNLKINLTWKKHLVRTLCNNFGFCKIDLHRKNISSKIYALKAESNRIMNSINGIKGILNLLQIHRIKNNNLVNLHKQFIKNDIEKLHAIVKDKSEQYNLKDLTQTQKVQVAYIKQNHKIFTQSMENFAHILNDIVRTKPSRIIFHPKVLDHYFINPNNHRVIKATKVNVNKNITIEQKLDKIKALLLNYNLVQNKFMKRMYDVIMSLEIQRNTTKYKEKHTKVNNEIKNNDKVALEVYTKNIIENLRKLKNLAQKFGIKNRPKREAMEDDGLVEYLLILMEYLLKQKKQLRISPVSDGIDLLINAIKSAPDIKVSRKKVLEYVPARVEEETTESILTLPNAIKMDETNNTASYAVPKFKTFESMDEDEENSDYYQYYKKEHKSNNFNVKEMPETEDTVYFSTTQDTVISLSNNEKNNVVKENGKGYELFTDEPEEDDGDVLTTTKPLDIISKSLTHHIPTRIPLGILENGQSTSKQANDAHIHNSRIKLSWIEESYNQEEERKELPRFTETTTQKQSPTHAALVLFTRTRVNKKAKLNKYDDPISSISKEITDEESKRTKYFNSEYVMYKKQMNFLNSLDYGTEKIDIDGDSKEDKPNVEQFPLYFV